MRRSILCFAASFLAAPVADAKFLAAHKSAAASLVADTNPRDEAKLQKMKETVGMPVEMGGEEAKNWLRQKGKENNKAMRPLNREIGKAAREAMKKARAEHPQAGEAEKLNQERKQISSLWKALGNKKAASHPEKLNAMKEKIGMPVELTGRDAQKWISKRSRENRDQLRAVGRQIGKDTRGVLQEAYKNHERYPELAKMRQLRKQISSLYKFMRKAGEFK